MRLSRLQRAKRSLKLSAVFAGLAVAAGYGAAQSFAYADDNKTLVLLEPDYKRDAFGIPVVDEHSGYQIIEHNRTEWKYENSGQESLWLGRGLTGTSVLSGLLAFAFLMRSGEHHSRHRARLAEQARFQNSGQKPAGRIVSANDLG